MPPTDVLWSGWSQASHRPSRRRQTPQAPTDVALRIVLEILVKGGLEGETARRDDNLEMGHVILGWLLCLWVVLCD